MRRRLQCPTPGRPLLLLLLLTALGACSPGNEPSELPTTLTPEESGWPRRFAAEGTAVTIYQPQVESWVQYSAITFRAAVSFTPEGAEEPAFGAIKVTADTDADLENRRVLLGDLEIAGSAFPTLDEEASAEWTRRIGGILPQEPMPVDLDRILAYFEHTEAETIAEELESGGPAEARDEIAHDAPRIFVSQRPAILVMLDGEPVLYPVEGTGLMFAVNTNWDLFFDPGAGRYYLLDLIAPEADAESAEGEALWLTAARLDGPWTVADQLPGDFLRLPEGEDWAEVRKHLQASAADARTAGEPPAVFTSTRPAELIVIDGAPKLTPIEDGRLMWVANTEADLFLFGGDGAYYYLVSGRWFRAATLDGPWDFATAELPAEFAAIPADHEKASVLASVPGTPHAAEAVRLVQVPTKATVKRSEATAEVAYQGEPEFREIEGTSMEYATNTASDVIRVGDLYYLCLQGVWFVSASATGPWQVADSVAEEIYTIPTSSPVHHTTYVEVYDSGPDWVTVGYTAAYLGLMVALFDDDPVVVYGTGWYYPPYVYHGPRPVYYPYHHSYGAAAWYNPATGTYGRGASVYGPYGGAGRAAAYNPRTGTYARGAAAWGPYGGTAAYQAYNPRTDTYRAGYRSANPYASWGEGVVERGDKWAHGGYYSDSRGTVAGVHTSEGGRAVAARTSSGRTFIGGSGDDVYAGRNGQVYKRSDGGWSRYDSGNWNQVSTSQRAEVQNRASQAASSVGSGAQSKISQKGVQRSQLSDGQGAEAQRRATQVPSSLRREAQATSTQTGGQRSQLSASQRAEVQNRSSQARAQAQARAGSWDRSSSQRDVVRQLDSDARARAQGSERAQQYRTQGASGARSQAAAGRARGGGRGRGR